MSSTPRFHLSLVLILSLFLAANGLAQAVQVPPGINLRRTVTVEVVQKTKNAVVNISTTTTKLVHERVNPFPGDPFFQNFGINEVVRVPANSLGSGFIVHSDGYVVTNNHVIEGARKITVELADGRKLPADLLCGDPDADLALLRIHSDTPLPTLELGDSADLMIGEPVIAVGNPLGYSHSVSTGIVSALHRDLNSKKGQTSMADLIQTDAAINPGNSGGPLLNAYGQVIGINTAIRSDAQNIGFAIPINRLRKVVPVLMNPEHVTKVGMSLGLTERVTSKEPAIVDTQVMLADSDQPVSAINGQAPRDIIDAYAMLLRIKTGQQVTVALADGTTRQFKTKTYQEPLSDAVVQAKQRLGITIEPVNAAVAEKLNLDSEDGILITQVSSGSIAANAGIIAGDIIVRFGGQPVQTLDDLAKLFPRLPEHGPVQIGVVRGDQLGVGILRF